MTLLSSNTFDRVFAPVVTSGVVNVVNFMDGINGISGITGVVWGLNAMALDPNEGDLTTLGALTAGASLGFLPHNIPSARLFLGDVGSYALGSAIAAAILGQSNLKSRYKVAAPLLLYGVDATQALLRRAADGKSLSEAHRDHIYQRLVDEGGISHTKVALIHGGGAAALASASRLHPLLAVPLTASVVTAYLLMPALIGHEPASSQPEVIE